jgi:hypothetical protein
LELHGFNLTLVHVRWLREDLSLTDLKKQMADFIRPMTETGEPLLPIINGKVKRVVQDAELYQKLLDSPKEAPADEPIRRDLKDLNAGHAVRLGDLGQYVRETRGNSV